MADLTAIIESSPFREIVQQNLLQRKFYDALYPANMFPAEADAEQWEAEEGDTKVFTGKGLIAPKVRRLAAGTDPTPSSYGLEQWTATCGRWLDSIDTDMPTAILACVNKLLQDVDQMGLAGAQTKDRLCRSALFNAGLSGWTVVDTTANSTTIRLKRLNGFTRVRRPDLAGGSKVKYDPVSTANPLSVTFYPGGIATVRNVVGFSPDFPNDETGPGTVTLSASVNVTARDAVKASSATAIVRSGGGNSVGALGTSDILKLADLRAAITRLEQMNVKPHGDGYFHGHMDSTSHNQVFSDQEVQRLNIGTGNDGLMYKEMILGKLLGGIWYKNQSCPRVENVGTGLTGQTDGSDDIFDPTDPNADSFAGELFDTGDPATATTTIHRVLVTGREALKDYWVDCGGLVPKVPGFQDVGMSGGFKSGINVTNDSVTVMCENVWMYVRRPLDRAGEKVSTTYKFLGDQVVRSDGATGDAARYKRVCVIEHAEAL